VGAFEDRKTFYYFLIAMAKNLVMSQKNGKGNDKRYHPNTLQLYEVLANIGGSSSHYFMSLNLYGLVLNTTKANFRKEGFMYVIGIQEETFKFIASIFKTLEEKGVLCNHAINDYVS
jgi:hypothetical protein